MAAFIINIFLITLSIAVIITTILIYNNSSKKLSENNVYSGVQISGEDVGGMTYEELLAYLEKEFGGSLDNKNITIRIGDLTEKYSFAELGVRYNTEEAARQAFEMGRSGGGFERMKEISDLSKNTANIPLVYTYDREKVDILVDRIAEEAGVLSENSDVTYTQTAVIIKPGREGVKVDKNDLAEKLQAALESFESAEIEVKLIMSPPNRLDAEKIFETIFKEARDACYKVSDDHRSVTVESEVPGQTVDRDKLIGAVEALNNRSSAEVTIPLLAVEPQVRKSDLSGQLFLDKLGGASTNFSVNSQNNKNRRDNMTLATKKITGYILGPGDEFDFNEVVGKRTEANGYKMAGAFMDGQLIDDVGGGICQVSSTLYNAVLYADLAVTARINHSYLVSYVQKGFDATVSYPQPDFKFKNNTKHPIRVDCGVEGTTISFTILGTQVGPKKKITFSSEVRDSIEFKKVTTEDATLPVGTTNIIQAGRIGYTIDSYKTVQIGDGPKETIKIATNKYKAMDQIQTIGTKPVAPNEAIKETVIAPPSDESDFVSGIDTAQSQGSSGGQSETGGGDGNSSTGETARPIRTPRRSTESGQTADETTTAINQNETTTKKSTKTTQDATQETSASERPTTSRGERATTTKNRSESTTPADDAPATTTKAGGDGDASAPKRTPRPTRQT